MLISQVELAGICGSDLHRYHENPASPENPQQIGHEAIGYIEEVGDSVEVLGVGDWVVIPFEFDDGHYQYGPEVGAPLASSTGMQGEFFQSSMSWPGKPLRVYRA